MRSHGMSLSEVGALLGGVVGLGTIAGVMLGAVVGGHELTPAEQVDYFAHLAWLNPSATCACACCVVSASLTMQ